jgi:putative membrane-bound dehydrogenase-like protein
MHVLALALATSLAGQDVRRPVAVDERLTVDLVAAEPEIVTPTSLDVDARGRAWAIESNTHFPPKNYKGHPTDRILVFDDYAPDGRARKVTAFADGFRYGMSLALRPEGVYFATRWEVLLLRDTNGDDVCDERTLLARLETKGDYPHNGLCGFAFDAQGFLYFGMGENLGVPYRLVGSDGTVIPGDEGGKVFRCRPDGSGLVRFSTGFWNPFHMAFDAFGRLFVVDNDPDSRPPCRLLHVVSGSDFGYKFRNGRKGLHPYTAWNGELPGTLPMVAGTGEAPSGVLAYESDGLPEDYRGTLLVTSWGDHVLQRFRPVARGASFTAAAETVLKGDDTFRPVGIAAAPDGSVFLTDWVDKSYTLHLKGRIWRVRAKTPPPKGSDPEHALEFLSHPKREVRERAGASLAKTNPAALRSVIEKDANLRARIQALWSGALVEQGLADPDEAVRGEAVRMLEGDEARKLRFAAGDPSKFVRMQAVLGLRAKESLARILPVLADPDPFLAGAAVEALSRGDSAWLQEQARSPDAKVRVGVLVAMRRKGDPGCRAAVPALLEDPDPAVRRAAIQWVGEEGLKEHAEAARAAASRPPVTKEIFEAYLAATDFLNASERQKVDQTGTEAYVARVLEDPGQAPALRALALRMLRPDHPAVAVSKLKELLAGPDPELRAEAARALVPRPDEAAQAALRQAAADPLLRLDAIAGLSHSAATSADTRAILLRHLKEDPGLREAVLPSLAGALADPDVRRAVEGLAPRSEKAALLLGAEPPGRPGGPEEWQGVAAEAGDAAAGERVFFHPKGPQCFVCHRVNGRGGIVGPDLSNTGAVLDRRRLVESILEPSKEVAPMFVAWKVRTKKGDVVDGRVLYEDPSPTGHVVIVNAQGQQTKVKNADVEERQPSKVSIMPEKLHAVLTRKEFRDLIAYLSALR